MIMSRDERRFMEYQEHFLRLKNDCVNDVGFFALNTVMPGLLPEQYESSPLPQTAETDRTNNMARSRGNVALLHTIQRPAPTSESILGYAEAA